MKRAATLALALLLVLVALPARTQDLGERLVRETAVAQAQARQILAAMQHLNEVFRRYAKFMLRTFGNMDEQDAPAMDILSKGIDLNIDVANFANEIYQQAPGQALNALQQAARAEIVPSAMVQQLFSGDPGRLLGAIPALANRQGGFQDFVLNPAQLARAIPGLKQGAGTVFDIGKVIGQQRGAMDWVLMDERPDLYGGLPAMTNLEGVFKDAGFVGGLDRNIGNLQDFLKTRVGGNISIPGVNTATVADLLSAPLSAMKFSTPQELQAVLAIKDQGASLFGAVQNLYAGKLADVFSSQFGALESVGQITSRTLGIDLAEMAGLGELAAPLGQIQGLAALGAADPGAAMEKYRQMMVSNTRLPQYGEDNQPFSNPAQPVRQSR